MDFSREYTDFAVKVSIERSKVNRFDNVMLSVRVNEVVSLSKNNLNCKSGLLSVYIIHWFYLYYMYFSMVSVTFNDIRYLVIKNIGNIWNSLSSKYICMIVRYNSVRESLWSIIETVFVKMVLI